MNICKWIIYFFGGLVLIFLTAPTLIVIPMSFSSSEYLEFPMPGFSTKWYEAFFSDTQWIESLWLSIKIGGVTMIVSTVLGTLVSISIARSKAKWMNIIYYAMISPMIVPLIIVAVIVYSLFIRVNLQGTFFGLVVAHTIVAIPYVVTTVLGSLRSFDIRIEQAAISLGAHPITAFFKITIPIISPALISGALFAFIISFDELIISIFVSDAFMKTLPVRMWESIRLTIDPTLAAIASTLIFISILLFFVIEIIKFISNKRGLS